MTALLRDIAASLFQFRDEFCPLSYCYTGNCSFLCYYRIFFQILLRFFIFHIKFQSRIRGKLFNSWKKSRHAEGHFSKMNTKSVYECPNGRFSIKCVFQKWHVWFDFSLCAVPFLSFLSVPFLPGLQVLLLSLSL